MSHFFVGGAGAVGSAVIPQLLRGGHRVVATVRKTPFPQSFHTLAAANGGSLNVACTGFDIRDAKALRKVIAAECETSGQAIDCIWSLAAPLSVETAENPAVAEAVTVGGMKDILDAVKDVCGTNHNVKLLFTDSIGSYGAEGPRELAPARWLVENPTQDPGSDYGVLKRKCRGVLNDHAVKYNFDTRWAVVPGVLHSQPSWGSGTTEYALECLKFAVSNYHGDAPAKGVYGCPIVPATTRLPMIHATDLAIGLTKLATADRANLKEPERGYAIAGFSFSCEELFNEIKENYYADFKYEYQENVHVNRFAHLWVDSLSPAEASRDFGYEASFGFKKTIREIVQAHVDRDFREAPVAGLKVDATA